MTPSPAASLATWISRVGLVVADETEFLGQLYARAEVSVRAFLKRMMPDHPLLDD